MKSGRRYNDWLGLADCDELPMWLAKPRADSDGQGCLFSLPPDKLLDVLADAHVSVDEFKRWHELGWLSFGFDMSGPITQPHLNELEIVRAISHSALSNSQIQALLAELPRPVLYPATAITYSFEFGWVVTVPVWLNYPGRFMSGGVEEFLRAIEFIDEARLRKFQKILDEAIVIRDRGTLEDDIDYDPEVTS